MKLDSIFTDHAVFPANKPIIIFGTGSGRAAVKFNGIITEINSEGDRWQVELPKMDYGGPYTMEFLSDEGNEALTDIYIGEVLLFSGQSNMAFQLKDSVDTPLEYYSDTFPLLRYVEINESNTLVPWIVACGDYAPFWSAIGYIAGRECARKKGVAIGVITSL